MVDGKIVAVVKRSSLRSNWGYCSADVYVEGKKIFSVPENDSLDGGVTFIYPFADGKRFLCDYDNDTSMLDFVVDFRDSAKNEPRSSGWPPNDNVMGNYVRTYMASTITNVVYAPKGVVRLPNYLELQEVSSYLASTNPTQTKAGYFDFFSTKKSLLLDLATNRQSVWPLGK